jgi:hypothetical protein
MKAKSIVKAKMTKGNALGKIFMILLIGGSVFPSCSGLQADDELLVDSDSLSIIIPSGELTYKIVDTGTVKYFNNQNSIGKPEEGEAFYGQDAHFTGNLANYFDNGDGTISDLVTDLMWTKSPDLNGDSKIDANDKLSYAEAIDYAKSATIGGYDDWRVPSIKELYSLVDFSGIDPSGYNGSADGLVPFIDTDYFEFGYGDESAGDRIIDAQMVSSTLYKGSALMSDEIMFGFNFADGRIKGYPYGQMPNGQLKGYYVYLVRGNASYGQNDFLDNEDHTISDKATGLMWSQDDSYEGMNWEDALDWVQMKNQEKYLGYSDWRMPDVKELESIVDYSRSLQETNSAAINPLFNCTEITDEGGNRNFGFYWSSTTHENMRNGGNACYVCFGEALGFFEMPPMSGNYNLMDVHGAGAQRSDPKVGDPEDYPNGHGPQGDVIRIYNFVRLVRTIN